MNEMPRGARPARAKPARKAAPEEVRSGGVQSVDRALHILEVLGEDAEG